MTELKVYLCNSQQIDALRDRIQQLSGDLEDLQKRYDLLEGRFGRECSLNLYYMDLLRQNDIKFRR